MLYFVCLCEHNHACVSRQMFLNANCFLRCLNAHAVVTCD